MLILFRSLLQPLTPIEPPPQPENGPSGGVSWLRGYAPKFDYGPKPPRSRRARRDEILFLAPKV